MRKKGLEKIGRLLAGLLLWLLPAATASAGTAGQATVIYEVEPAWQVEFPGDTTVPFETSEAAYGRIVVTEALLEEGKCIRVTMNADGILRNTENPEIEIPYRILNDGKPFTGATYTAAGEETKLMIAIAPEDWKRAVSGEYRTSITFQTSYEEKRSFRLFAPAAGRNVGTVTTETGTIGTTVPSEHTISVVADHASALYLEGTKGESDAYAVPRFSEPSFRINTETDWSMVRVLLNDTDVTDKIQNGVLKLPAVSGDQVITIETRDNRTSSGDSGTSGEHGGSSDTGDTDTSQTGEQAEAANAWILAAKTGDSSVIWYILFLCSVGLLAAVLICRRRKR